jgi:hypothetical protein
MTVRRFLIAGGAIAAMVGVPAMPLHSGSGGSAGADTAQPSGPAPATADGPDGRVALAGPWTVTRDSTGHGELKGWQAGTFGGHVVDVPFVPDAGDVTGRRGLTNFRGSVAWYRTTFTVPADDRYAIDFESVHHRAEVWLDGRLLGRHTGAYLPFQLRTSLKAGVTHTLVVRADWRGPAEMKREGWHRTWFNFGGVNREVTIRPLGPSDLSAPTIETRLRNGAAIVDVSIHVRNFRYPRQIPLSGTLVHGDQRIPIQFPTLTFQHNQTAAVHAQVVVPNPALWSPDAPNLYDLDFTVPGEAGYHTRVGLRELEWSGPHLYLNGKPLFLKGASIQEDVRGRGDALTPSDMDAIVAQLKALGANATRSQHPLNPALLERFDAAGILVWQGLGPVDAPGSWTSVTPAQQAIARQRVRTTFWEAQTHPSIIAWNLANEVAGNGHPGGQAQFIDDMARELHARDPGRMVAVDVWGMHAPDVAGPMYSHIDAIGATNYVGWYENTFAPPAQMSALIRARVQRLERVFAGKVLIISEFGAESNSRNPTDKPGGFNFQSRLLATHLRTYKAMTGLSGALVWNLRDFAVSPAFAGGSIKKLVPGIHIVRGLNTKGLLTYGGRPKPAFAVVRQLFAQF